MTKKSKVHADRLRQLESEFELLLLSCLRECAEGRYGLFGQNDHADPEYQYTSWPEAQRVVSMAEEIQSLLSESGECNLLAERLLTFRSLHGSNIPGEPKLARKILDEITLSSSTASAIEPGWEHH